MTTYQKILDLAHKKKWSKWPHSDIFSDGTFEKDERDLMGELLTMILIQKWLRDVHNKHVQITAEYYSDGINWNVQVLWLDENDHHDYTGGTMMYGDNGEFSTYEAALEFGLGKALNLI